MENKETSKVSKERELIELKQIETNILIDKIYTVLTILNPNSDSSIPNNIFRIEGHKG